MITKQDWIDAGRAIKDIDIAEVEKKLNIKVPAEFGWFAVCSLVYKTITGNVLHYPYHGIGRSSRHGGEKVAEVWEE